MIRILVTALLANMAINAEARIGETSAECESRYGKGRLLELTLGAGLADKNEKPWQAMIYTTRGLTIQAVFENDRVVFIRYSNEPVLKLADNTPPAVDLTGPEIEFLKKANGSSWFSHKDPTLTKIAPTVKVWKSSDKTHYAGYDRERKALFVCTNEFWQIVVGEILGRYKEGASGSAATRLKGL